MDSRKLSSLFGTPVKQIDPAAGPKVFHLPGWGVLPDPSRIGILRKLTLEFGRDPRIRDLAIDICQKAGAQPRDYPKQAAALHKWIQTNIKYFNEPQELLQAPDYTLFTRRQGDCDDMAIALAALYESVRLPWRFVLSGKDKRSGQVIRWIEGTPVVRADWSHIYVQVGWPPFQPVQWAFVEPTIKHAPFGWDVVDGPRLPGMAASSAPLPELAGAQALSGIMSDAWGPAFTFGAAPPASTAAASGGGVVAATASSEFSWTKIATAVGAGVVTSVLSQIILDKIRRS